MQNDLIDLLTTCRSYASIYGDILLLADIDSKIEELREIPEPREWDCNDNISIVRADNGSYFIRKAAVNSILWWNGACFRKNDRLMHSKPFVSVYDAYVEYLNHIKDLDQ